MTDTQFQVGLVYATRGGDRVRVTGIGDPKGDIYPVYGDFISGPYAPQFGAWMLDGRFSTAAETPCDLLPGALPTPIPEAADDKAELLAVCRRMFEWARDGNPFQYPPGSLQELEEAIAKAERT